MTGSAHCTYVLVPKKWHAGTSIITCYLQCDAYWLHLSNKTYFAYCVCAVHGRFNSTITLHLWCDACRLCVSRQDLLLLLRFSPSCMLQETTHLPSFAQSHWLCVSKCVSVSVCL